METTIRDASITIHAGADITLQIRSEKPTVTCVQGATGAFFALRPGRNLCLILEGYDQETIAHARALAAVLTEAADALEHELAAKAEEGRA